MKNIAPVLPEEVYVREITRPAMDAWQEQWKPVNTNVPPEGGWDWPDIWTDRRRSHTEVFHSAVWTRAGRLCGLAIGVPNKTAVVLEGIEADPNCDNPAKGLILLTVLEAASCYAQITGRSEIWAKEPANERLVDLYVNGFGFEHMTPKGQKPYCRKRV